MQTHKLSLALALVLATASVTAHAQTAKERAAAAAAAKSKPTPKVPTAPAVQKAPTRPLPHIAPVTSTTLPRKHSALPPTAPSPRALAPAARPTLPGRPSLPSRPALQSAPAARAPARFAPAAEEAAAPMTQAPVVEEAPAIEFVVPEGYSGAAYKTGVGYYNHEHTGFFVMPDATEADVLFHDRVLTVLTDGSLADNTQYFDEMVETQRPGARQMLVHIKQANGTVMPAVLALVDLPSPIWVTTIAPDEAHARDLNDRIVDSVLARNR